jgi:hypothetical protein
MTHARAGNCQQRISGTSSDGQTNTVPADGKRQASSPCNADPKSTIWSSYPRTNQPFEMVEDKQSPRPQPDAEKVNLDTAPLNRPTGTPACKVSDLQVEHRQLQPPSHPAATRVSEDAEAQSFSTEALDQSHVLHPARVYTNIPYRSPDAPRPEPINSTIDDPVTPGFMAAETTRRHVIVTGKKYQILANQGSPALRLGQRLDRVFCCI